MMKSISHSKNGLPQTNPFILGGHACMSDVHVGGVGVMYAQTGVCTHLHAEAGGGHQVPSSINLCHIPLNRVSH